MLVVINTTLVYLCLLGRIDPQNDPNDPLTPDGPGDICPGLTMECTITHVHAWDLTDPMWVLINTMLLY